MGEQHLKTILDAVEGLTVGGCHPDIRKIRHQGNTRVAIGVEVADDQHVRIAAGGRIGGQPVAHRLGGQRPCAVAVTLAVAQIRIAVVVAG